MTAASPKTRAAGPHPHLLDSTYAELEAVFSGFAGQGYRLDQVCEWTFVRRAETFEAMTNLPADLREALERRFSLRRLKSTRAQKSRLDGTVKFGFDSGDSEEFSAVFLPHLAYRTLCISTQVGCAWKCRFCASGLVPFQRNLTSGEILDQIFLAEAGTHEKIQNVLFMGMGEPLANYEGTVKAIRWMTAPRGLRMNPARITLSTTGVAPQIRKLACEHLRVNLALSLHAPTDELRRQIMPVSSKFPIREVLEACKLYQTKNRAADFTIEYILLKGVNDMIPAAEELAWVLRAARFPTDPKINLIPYNPVGGLPFKAPEPGRAQAFFNLLKGKKFNVHTRKPQGQDIDGACGQLL